jgi:predicted transcriptional regulator
MPVILSRLKEHPVTWTDDLYRLAVALAEADTLGDVDRLTERVGVPGRRV